MKPLVFEEVKIRWVILKANTLFTLKESLAYSLNNWGGLASTITYMLTYLVLLSAIFGRIKTLAGYNYSEILMLTLVSQFNFYLAWVWSIRNLDQLGEDVKTGKLDLILTKPLPALWYVTFQKVNLFMLVFEMWPATLPLIYLLIKNMDFQISLRGLFLGLLSFVFGHIAIH
ncbi:MAG: Multidrug efflux associated membrane protein, partial [Candidatus Collierbacteria bacterium GW2011_GWC2_44_18]